MKRLMLLALLAPAVAEAQTGRAYLGAVVGAHSEDADHVTGRAPSVGVVAGVRLSSSWGIEVEMGKPTHAFTREYTGFGQTFAAPGSSRVEIERLGVFESFRTERTVRTTISVGAVYQPRVHPRIQPRLFMGMANHHVRERFLSTILRLPEGVDPERLRNVRGTDQTNTRHLGGISVGGGLGVALTRHVSIVPEVRYDYGSIGDEINNVWRTSIRTVWSF
jgi:hypothetical protein